MNLIVQCATFSKSLNPQNIDKSISDIRIRIQFPFESSFWISLSGCKLTILPDIQPANRIVIISGAYVVTSVATWVVFPHNWVGFFVALRELFAIAGCVFLG